MIYKKLAKKIIALQQADFNLRQQLIADENLFDGYNAEMEALHNNNAILLDSIIRQIGYPTIRKVGKEANSAAWLVIQHAIGQPDFMKKCLALLIEAVADQDADPKNLAYLTDRIAVLEGKQQLYGTQFDWDKNGNLNCYLLDDSVQVNLRRRALGLNSVEEQTVLIQKTAEKENQLPPKNVEARKQEFECWRKRVGWSK